MISVALLPATLIRSKVRFFQRFSIPNALAAEDAGRWPDGRESRRSHIVPVDAMRLLEVGVVRWCDQHCISVGEDYVEPFESAGHCSSGWWMGPIVESVQRLALLLLGPQHVEELDRCTGHNVEVPRYDLTKPILQAIRHGDFGVDGGSVL